MLGLLFCMEMALIVGQLLTGLITLISQLFIECKSRYEGTGFRTLEAYGVIRNAFTKGSITTYNGGICTL